MTENLCYSIFKTRWGWFGLLGDNVGLIRTYLPMADKEAVKIQLLKSFPKAKLSKTLFSMLEKQIRNYYEGQKVDFSRTKISLEGFTEFQQHVLMALKAVKYGKKFS